MRYTIQLKLSHVMFRVKFMEKVGVSGGCAVRCGVVCGVMLCVMVEEVLVVRVGNMECVKWFCTVLYGVVMG